MYIGSFGTDLETFEDDITATVTQFNKSGVSQLIIDLTNNPGQDISLPEFAGGLIIFQVVINASDISLDNTLGERNSLTSELCLISGLGLF